ncbi:unnamed protein product [Phaeothamnion confervicola]
MMGLPWPLRFSFFISIGFVYARTLTLVVQQFEDSDGKGDESRRWEAEAQLTRGPSLRAALETAMASHCDEDIVVAMPAGVHTVRCETPIHVTCLRSLVVRGGGPEGKIMLRCAGANPADSGGGSGMDRAVGGIHGDGNFGGDSGGGRGRGGNFDGDEKDFALLAVVDVSEVLFENISFQGPAGGTVRWNRLIRNNCAVCTVAAVRCTLDGDPIAGSSSSGTSPARSYDPGGPNAGDAGGNTGAAGGEMNNGGGGTGGCGMRSGDGGADSVGAKSESAIGVGDGAARRITRGSGGRYYSGGYGIPLGNLTAAARHLARQTGELPPLLAVSGHAGRAPSPATVHELPPTCASDRPLPSQFHRRLATASPTTQMSVSAYENTDFTGWVATTTGPNTWDLAGTAYDNSLSVLVISNGGSLAAVTLYDTYPGGSSITIVGVGTYYMMDYGWNDKTSAVVLFYSTAAPTPVPTPNPTAVPTA